MQVGLVKVFLIINYYNINKSAGGIMTTENSPIYFENKSYQRLLAVKQQQQRFKTLPISANLQLTCLSFLALLIPLAAATNGILFSDNKGGIYFATSGIENITAGIIEYVQRGACNAKELIIKDGIQNLSHLTEFCARPQYGERRDRNPPQYVQIFSVNGTKPDELFVECLKGFFSKVCSTYFHAELKKTLPLAIIITLLLMGSIFYCMYRKTRATNYVYISTNPYAINQISNSFQQRFENLNNDLMLFKQLCNQNESGNDLLQTIDDLLIDINIFEKQHKCLFSHHIMNRPVTMSSGITCDSEGLWDNLNHGRRTCPVTQRPLLETIHQFPNVNVDRKTQIDEGLTALEKRKQQLETAIASLNLPLNSESSEVPEGLRQRKPG
jgi:hypothetical protein